MSGMEKSSLHHTPLTFFFVGIPSIGNFMDSLLAFLSILKLFCRGNAPKNNDSALESTWNFPAAGKRTTTTKFRMLAFRLPVIRNNYYLIPGQEQFWSKKRNLELGEIFFSCWFHSTALTDKNWVPNEKNSLAFVRKKKRYWSCWPKNFHIM